MFVYNNFLNDSRVEKEAETLVKAGYQVTVSAFLDEKTKCKEERNGIKIVRTPLSSWYMFLVSLFKKSRWRKFPYLTNKSISDKNCQESSIQESNFRKQGSVFNDYYEKDKYADNSFCHYKDKGNMRFKFIKSLLAPINRYFCLLYFYQKNYTATAKEKFDIYHAHDLNTLPIAYLAARRNNAKLVYDSHELYVERNTLKPSSKFWKWVVGKIEGFLVNRTDAVFTVNESLALELSKRYKIRTPGVVMNTPALFEKSKASNLGNNHLRTKFSLPKHVRLLIYVGGITFNRGLEELIESLKYLPDCFLIYMGYGNEQYKQSLLNLARHLGLADRLSFFGPVPSHQVIYYTACADLGVAPIANACLSYYYCSPNKLFEYMNAGIPVIASDFPELRKIVLGHEIGLTFDPSDPKDIAGAARAILNNPEAMDKMHKNSLKASKLYNWENESEKLLQIYSAL